jgi:hypothetical protein
LSCLRIKLLCQRIELLRLLPDERLAGSEVVGQRRAAIHHL